MALEFIYTPHRRDPREGAYFVLSGKELVDCIPVCEMRESHLSLREVKRAFRKAAHRINALEPDALSYVRQAARLDLGLDELKVEKKAEEALSASEELQLRLYNARPAREERAPM